MIVEVIVGGIGLIVVIAVVVGIVDAAHASAWRRIAAERRRNWEARQLEPHGEVWSDSWDDD
jgi:hypothetical protein